MSNSIISREIDGIHITEYDEHNIYIFENILSNEDCEDFIDFIEKIPLIKTIHHSHNNVECYCYNLLDLLNTRDEEYYEFPCEIDEFNKKILELNSNDKKSVSTNRLNGIKYKDIHSIINKLNEKMDFVNNVIQKINHRVVLNCNSGYNFRKIYGLTRCHTDGLSEIDDSSKLVFIKKNKINTNAIRVRNASIIISLNDNYNGGIFNFPKQKVSFKLKKGSVLIFPPYWTHPHEVTQVDSGLHRYTINTWSYQSIFE